MCGKKILFTVSLLVLLVSTKAQNDTLTISHAKIHSEEFDTISVIDAQDLAETAAAKKRAAMRNEIKSDNTTVPAEKKPQKEEKKFVPNPKWALVFAIIPGGGQIYNRKYWKLPIVYGGFMGLAYAIIWNGGYYNEYKTAYRDISLFIDGKEGGDSWKNFIRPPETEETVSVNSLKSMLQGKMETYRRNRDLSIIGAVVLYGLSMIDAFVDAKLFDFDISPDLSLHLEPYLAPDYYNRTNFGISCRLKF